jgi:hypothetical protein
LLTSGSFPFPALFLCLKIEYTPPKFFSTSYLEMVCNPYTLPNHCLRQFPIQILSKFMKEFDGILDCIYLL